MFKTLSLIIIIIILSACVFALFGDALTEPFTQNDAHVRDYAFSVDQLGNIYFMRREKETQSLIVLDSTGEELLREDISAHFEGNFFVDNIFILQNKNIWITGYDFEPETMIIGGVKIIAFREDGSYIEDIYKTELAVFKDNLYRRLSSFDEDERCVYFARRNDSVSIIEVYAYVKDGSETLRKIGEYELAPDGAALIAFHTLPGGGVVASFSDGTLTMNNVRGLEDSRGSGLENARIDRFWNGAGVFYMRDAVSGTVYSSPYGQLRPVSVINGAFPVSSERGSLFRDMAEIAVSGVGNVLAVLHTETGSELYLGGFTFLPDVTILSHISHAEMADWLIAIATVAGTIISSVLIWEFFIHFMRMRMSIIIRHTLLTALVIFLAFFALSKYILIPSVTDALSRSYQDNLGSDSDVLLSALKTSVPSGSSAAEYQKFMETFGEEYNMSGHGNSPLYTYILASGDEGFRLTASNSKYPAGITMSSFLPYADIGDQLYAGAAPEGQYLTLETETGRKLAFLKNTEITIGGAETFLCVIENMSELEGRIGSFNSLISTYLLIVGVFLTVLLILTLVFHVVALRRLSGALHALGLGKYNVDIKINSGDETGEMYRHIKKLSEILREKDTSLQTLSTSYHRFVPARFMKLLGETKVENVRKDMQTRIAGAYVVVIRFIVSDVSDRNVFSNANLVLENIVPVVGKYGGTVYGFTNNGFDGVFEKSAQDALNAALSIRDVCRKLNMRLAEESGIQIDLRAVLIKGDLTLGFIGDQSRMEPTAISDVAPLAGTLISTCFGSNVYVTATGEFLGEIKAQDYRIRRVGKMIVGGAAIDFYDIYDSDPPALYELKKSFAEKLELGVNLFEKGDYRNAGKMFMDIIKHSTEDGVARNYLYLSEYNAQNANKQKYYTAYQRESERRYFNTRSDDYYRNEATDNS